MVKGVQGSLYFEGEQLSAVASAPVARLGGCHEGSCRLVETCGG